MIYTEQEINEAFQGLENIKKIIKQKNSASLMFGFLLCQAKQEKWFKKNGIEEADFLGDIRVNVKTAYSYEGLYKAFCKIGEYKVMDLADVDTSRLLKLKTCLFKSSAKGLPKLKVEKSVLEDWIIKAKELSTTDFNIEFGQAFKDKSREDHQHEWEEKSYWTCSVCGMKVWADPISSNHHHEDQ